ncbi:phosphoribosylglycinamide formyltransferase [Paenibacillus spiritus]|uniref:Phosphoribosylglycinamide formyltransferase n=1 Tax=Paenibacillus spiritus TaxID=2496557 RepID=A0A5J5FTP5_9BACL|nr:MULTISPECIES: phosphoribosylglycinamide formyltransferase [Paenibacillus]KAA8996861.1 phosphoribosylglycinamide formyltransferase [Paenibacillus spiritus]
MSREAPARIAVFASGQGSNFTALLEAEREGRLGKARIVLFVSDRPEAPAGRRAEEAGVPTLLLRPKDFSDRGEYEAAIVEELQRQGIDLIVLAGYMRLITPVLLSPFAGRILNIHPSLLPAFPGKDAIGQALAYGVKLTGVTVHIVDGGMDTGPVVAQRAVEVLETDDAASLAQRIHAAEHELYAKVVAAWSEGRIELDGRQAKTGGL